MKNLIILIFIIELISCDNRKDPYYGLDSGPVLQVMKITDNNPSIEMTDSVKMGQVYTFKYILESYESLTLNIEKSRVNDSVVIEDGLVHVNAGNEGISSYLLKTKDSFGKEATAHVQLTNFRNLKPICNFTVTKIGQLSPYEIEINASSSYDPDAKWGGQVVWYQYQIQTDYDVKNVLSSIRYICDGNGQKKITVRVQDNNGDWSDPKTIYFLLE